MTENKDWLVVGIITSPHGIAGKLNVKSLSDFEERFTKPGKRWLQKSNEIPTKYQLKSGYKKPGKELFIISLENINDRNQAEELKKYKILVKYKDIPKLKNGEFHISELLDLTVKILLKQELKPIGKICDLISDNSNLLVVKLYEGNKEVLIPFVESIVPEINKEEKYIIINPPKGLLEL